MAPDSTSSPAAPGTSDADTRSSARGIASRPPRPDIESHKKGLATIDARISKLREDQVSMLLFTLA